MSTIVIATVAEKANKALSTTAQVEADRTARVEIAKAESGRAGVVVNTTGK